MSILSTDTLVEIKEFFDSQLEITLNQINEGDSERLIKNKVNGFILAIQDKLL